MQRGFVKTYRKLSEWEWYTDSHMVHLLIHCILRANHKPAKWQGILVARGQFITGLERLSAETGISVQTIRTCLKRMEGQELTSKSTNKFRLITVLNYDIYQAQDGEYQQADQQATNKPLTNNQQATNSKQEGKEDKEGKEGKELTVVRKKRTPQPKFVPPEKRETADFFLSNHSTVEEAGKYWYHYDASGWTLGNGRKMKNWQSAAQKWILNSKTTHKNGTGTQHQRRNGTLADQQPLDEAGAARLIESIANDPRYE